MPLIVSWPGTIAANTITQRLTHVVDFYPTFVELGGASWQPLVDEHALDGVSFVDALRQAGSDRTVAREPIFYLFPGYLSDRSRPQASIIADTNDSRYKLIFQWETASWELYDLVQDPSEQINLAAEHPQEYMRIHMFSMSGIGGDDAVRYRPRLVDGIAFTKNNGHEHIEILTVEFSDGAQLP